MYKLKQMAKRGSALVGAVGLLAGITSSALPSLASANDLNPLTERSLTLSSSSPGWAYTDGSGNTTYAGPNTGTNGQKTGETFSFRTSSTADIKAFTFQFCTKPAGDCQSPGNDSGNTYPTGTRGADTSSTSDLNVVTDVSSNSEVAASDYTNTLSAGTGADFGNVKAVPDAQDTVSPYDHTNQHGTDDSNGIDGNFVVLYGSQASGHVTDVSSGWTMTADHQEESTVTQTGKNNLITLKIDNTSNTTGISLAPGDYVKIIFFGTDKNYITNPGADAFFVKINDFDQITNINPVTNADEVIDGGVTVANIMNQSIQIQTKVLETMDFSVGTVDPDTLTNAELSTATNGDRTAHGQCDPVLTSLTYGGTPNSLILGDSTAENSLATNKTFATHSFWRLSSNSSGGATVYYAGNTLSNTEGDKIAAIGISAAHPLTGTEQFGLALDNGSSGNYEVDYNWAKDSVGDGSGLWYETAADTGKTGLDASWTSAPPTNSHTPRLFPLTPKANYGGGTGGINGTEDGNTSSQYAFDPNSQTVPTAIASENSQVVDCVTGKMRYIANIAATTPAGIYTTKINYIAAPQY